MLLVKVVVLVAALLVAQAAGASLPRCSYAIESINPILR